MIAILFVTTAFANNNLDAGVSAMCENLRELTDGTHLVYNCADGESYVCADHDEKAGKVSGCEKNVPVVEAQQPPPPAPIPAPVATRQPAQTQQPSQPVQQVQYLPPFPVFPTGRCENFASWEGKSVLNSMQDVWGNPCFWESRDHRPTDSTGWTFENPDGSHRGYVIVIDDDVQVQYRGMDVAAVPVKGNVATLRKLVAREDGSGTVWLSMVEPGDISRTYLAGASGTVKIYEFVQLSNGQYELLEVPPRTASYIVGTQGQYTCLQKYSCS